VKEMNKMTLNEILHYYAQYTIIQNPKFSGSISNWEVNLVDSKQILKENL